MYSPPYRPIAIIKRSAAKSLMSFSYYLRIGGSVTSCRFYDDGKWNFSSNNALSTEYARAASVQSCVEPCAKNQRFALHFCKSNSRLDSSWNPFVNFTTLPVPHLGFCACLYVSTRYRRVFNQPSPRATHIARPTVSAAAEASDERIASARRRYLLFPTPQRRLSCTPVEHYCKRLIRENIDSCHRF